MNRKVACGVAAGPLFVSVFTVLAPDERVMTGDAMR
jgi:hypothetical protein